MERFETPSATSTALLGSGPARLSTCSLQRRSSSNGRTTFNAKGGPTESDRPLRLTGCAPQPRKSKVSDGGILRAEGGRGGRYCGGGRRVPQGDCPERLGSQASR